MRVRVMNRDQRENHSEEPIAYPASLQRQSPGRPRLSRSPVVPPRQGRRRGSG